MLNNLLKKFNLHSNIFLIQFCYVALYIRKNVEKLSDIHRKFFIKIQSISVFYLTSF